MLNDVISPGQMTPEAWYEFVCGSDGMILKWFVHLCTWCLPVIVPAMIATNFKKVHAMPMIGPLLNLLAGNWAGWVRDAAKAAAQQAPKAVLLLAVLTVLAACKTTTVTTTTPAIAATATTPAVPATTTTTVTTENLVDKLNKIAIPDLQAAAADAQTQSPPDAVAAQCYLGLVPVAQQVQKLVDQLTPPQTTTTTDGVAPPPAPVHGVVYDFQKLRDAKAAAAKLASLVASQQGIIAGLRVQFEMACGGLALDVNQGALDPLSLFSGPASGSGILIIPGLTK